jgi:hypothetical protein
LLSVMSEKERKIPVPRKNRLNELDGKTWTRYSISIWEISKTDFWVYRKTIELEELTDS